MVRDLLIGQSINKNEGEVGNEEKEDLSNEELSFVRVTSYSTKLFSSFHSGENLVIIFLSYLNRNENNKVKAIKYNDLCFDFYSEFQEVMFHQKPLLSNDTIIRLYLGDSYKQRGILHFIGNIESDSLISEGCLSLVSKLLDY